MRPSYLIYDLTDPCTNEVRYIGKSSSGLHRPRQHLDGLGHNQYKDRWINKIGGKYGIVILQRCKRQEDLADAEREWIAFYRSLGIKLVNLTNGGEGSLGYKHTPIARAKMTAWQIGRKLPLSTRLKMSYIRSGIPKSSEHRAKISAANKGRKFTDEHRANLSASSRWKT